MDRSGCKQVCHGDFLSSFARRAADTIEAATIDGANVSNVFPCKIAANLFNCHGGLDDVSDFGAKGFDIPYALSANDDDKLCWL